MLELREADANQEGQGQEFASCASLTVGRRGWADPQAQNLWLPSVEVNAFAQSDDSALRVAPGSGQPSFDLHFRDVLVRRELVDDVLDVHYLADLNLHLASLYICIATSASGFGGVPALRSDTTERAGYEAGARMHRHTKGP
jgi:hypothetical protein